MSSTNSGHIFQVAHQDASRYSNAGPVNLKDISEADARKIMSEEHKALGYRPPPGSLASQAQAAVARHETQHADEHNLTVDEEKLRQAALADAERIKQQRGNGNGGAAAQLDLNAVGEAEARKLMSDEHKALGYRPPPGSLAAEAQSAAAKHPDASAGVDSTILAKAALEDATHIASGNNAGQRNVDVHSVGEAEARKLMSEEHRALGYRPPPGSLAATAQSEAAKHPDARADVDPATLAHAALEDAERIAAQRAGDPVAQVNLNAINEPEARTIQSEEHRALGYRPPPGSLAAEAQSAAAKHPDTGAGVDPETLAQAAHEDAQRVAAERGSNGEAQDPAKELNLNTITAPEAHALQSEEHKTLGYRPPVGSAAAKAQSAVDHRAQVPVSKEMASSLVSQEHKARGHLPESGTIAPTAQSLADKNAQDGGNRTLADAGL